MTDTLLSQEELENECPEMMDDLELWLKSHDAMSSRPEATVYVLAQVLHERLKSLEMELEQKGAVISCIVRGFIEFNEDSLAAYKEMKRMISEQKASTLH